MKRCNHVQIRFTLPEYPGHLFARCEDCGRVRQVLPVLGRWGTIETATPDRGEALGRAVALRAVCDETAHYRAY